MTNRPTALGDLRVLDLAGPIGWYCTKLLADLGADVLRIEPPQGDPARKLAPFAHDDPSKSLPYWHFNTSKRTREIDLTTDAGKAELRALALEADILVESTTPGSGALGFTYDDIAADNPRLIWTAITPFGQTGPRAIWRGHDITGIAMGGLMNLAGVPASPPSEGAGDLGFQQASVIGAVGTMVALHERDKSGQGQLVDVSMQETVAAAIENTLPYLDLMGIPRKRLGYKSFGGQTAVFECKDGWLVGWLGRRWDAFTQWLDEVHMLPEEWRDPKWKDEVYRFQHLDDIDEVMSKLTMNLNKEEIYVASQEHRIANAPVATIDELFTKDPQLAGREFWVDVEQQDGTIARMPGAPYRFTETPWRISRPAPLPGEHNGQGWITPRSEPRPPRPTSREAGPLAGLRVIDFTWQIAGPLTSQVFADHGADVLKIESNVHPDGLRNMPVPRPPGTDSMNQSGIFNLFNSSKRSITLDLRTPEGMNLLRQLISIADVTLDNYGVDPFPRWGLTPEKLWELNPELIIARSSVMGRSGPRKDFIGFGYSISAAAGLNSHTGFPGDPPVGMVIAQPDYSSNPYHLATAILAAIHYRERTGRGQLIDLSQHESTVIFNGPALLDYTVNGRVAKPRMNRNPNFAPHGAYRARGEDRWIALMCENDADWRMLAEVIGRPDLADDPRFATLAGRKAHEDELDAIISEWTRLWSPHEAMEILQNAGLAAGAVQNSVDLNRDPHLRFRQQLVRVPHAELGRMTLPRRGFVLSRTPGKFRRPPVLLGEDTDDILRDLLALDEDKLAMAYVEGVIM